MSVIIQCNNFKMRNEVKGRLDQRLEGLVQNMPSPVSSKVSISQNSEGFIFSLVVNTIFGLFSAESFVGSKKYEEAERSWQMEEMDFLVQDIEAQIKKWNHQK